MNKDLTLLIMAAGMGSRFGGLKQIEPVGPNGEFIIDYSVYDALKAGFNKVVFIIKEENFDVFKETIGARVDDKIKVEYVFQKSEDLPSELGIETREKPWGTGHAIRAARNVINEPFAVINSDDFYGRDAYIQIANYLRNSATSEYAMVGYHAKNTLTENGSVKRGVCEVKDDYLVKITESKVEEVGGIITASPLDGSASFEVGATQTVAMNFFGFKPSLFKILERDIVEFFNKQKGDYSTCEFLIPDVIEEGIRNNEISMKVLDTTARWYGVTYKEDKEEIVRSIKQMITEGEYPEKLWE